MAKEILWLIWSNEHGRWWGPGGRGYTPVIEEAGRYNRRQANQIVREANFAPHIKNEAVVLAPETFDNIIGAAPEVKGLLANLLSEGVSK